jgi:hypothetical protein
MTICVLLILAVQLASAWDMDGHRIITLIAGKLMSDRAEQYVRETIIADLAQDVPRAMAFASVWPDILQGDPAYAWATDLHFAYSDEATSCKYYDESRDCPNGRCIVTALANYTMRASDFGLSKIQRSEAFKFLLHFMGDIHQPLHLGFHKFEGATKLYLKSPKTSLHHVWDELLLEYKLDMTQPQYVDDWNYFDYFQVLMPEIYKEGIYNNKGRYFFSADDLASYGAVLSKVEQIATDTSSRLTCKIAYKHVDGSQIEYGHSLDDDYYKSRTSEMVKQFKVAGFRLASLLDAVAEKYFNAKAEACAKREAMVAIKSGSAKRGNMFSLLEGDESDSCDQSTNSLEGTIDEEEILKFEKTLAKSKKDVKIPKPTKNETWRKTKKSGKRVNGLTDKEFDAILADFVAQNQAIDPAPVVAAKPKPKKSKAKQEKNQTVFIDV